MSSSSAPFPYSAATSGVLGLRPYEPGKPVEELEREFGISGAVKLASNESPLGPSPAASRAASRALGELARYPDGNGFTLKSALSEHLGVAMECLTLGNGSNDILELLTRAFVTPEHEVVFSRHAFAVYPIVTQAVGARAVVVPARDWGQDLAATLAAITDRTRVVFVANPNNPTGTWLGQVELHAFIEQVPTEVLVVVDEAYFEYVADPGYGSALAWLDDFPNLLVTRTFSKAYGLAGLRVGYSVSSDGIADLLNRVRQPFNVNSVALAAASAALADSEHLQRAVELNRAGMRQLLHGLRQLGLDAIPSSGNFLAVHLGCSGREIYQALLPKGVIVRPVDNYEMPEHLRVTVGLPEENQRFLQALSEVFEERGVA